MDKKEHRCVVLAILTAWRIFLENHKGAENANRPITEKERSLQGSTFKGRLEDQVVLPVSPFELSDSSFLMLHKPLQELK